MVSPPTPTYTDGDWGYELNGTDATIVCYLGSSTTSLYIPAVVRDELSTYPVVALGDGIHPVFDSNTNIGNVTVSADTTMSRINHYAFRESRVVSFHIPSTVTYMGSYVFYKCSRLAEVYINSNLTALNGYVFADCPVLSYISMLPASITSIALTAFDGCVDLMRIDVASENPNYSSVDGVLFNKDKTTLVKFPGSLTPVLNEYTIPSTVTTLGYHAFQDNRTLRTVTIPSTVTTIDDSAFANCVALSTVNLPEGFTTIGSSMFRGCTSLTSITLPNSVTTIENYAFSGAGLTSIYLSDNVTSIGTGIFYRCYSLSIVRLPSNLTMINGSMFYECTGLTSIAIPETVTTIRDNAFTRCSSLQSITFPANVASIGTSYGHVFEGCTRLTQIKFKAAQPTITIYPVSFGLGTAASPVSATVASPNNWAVNVLDNYKNEYTSFTFVDITYTVALEPNDSSYGSVSPASISNITYDTPITTNDNTLTIGGVTATATPAQATAENMYVFSQWNNASGTVTDDRVVTAVFSIAYTAVWKNYDGSVLETDTGLLSGSTPAYDGPTPTKPSTSTAIYTFSGWSPAVGPITQNVEYTAQFTTTPLYTITWVNWDGTVLETDTGVPAGTTPTYDGETPTRPPGPGAIYTFSGWSPTVGPASGDTTYTAQYSTAPTYTITWVNWDGTVLEVDSPVLEGTTPTYNGATPTKPSTTQYAYTFSGWSPTVGPATGNATYTAQFTAIPLYTVVWKNWDGTVLETDTGLIGGTTPTYDGAVPTRSPTSSESYTFSGWSPAVGPITEDTVYTAQFTVTALYTVIWKNWDDTILETDTSVPEGTTPSYNSETPVRPSTAQYAYTFSGWSPAIAPLTADAVYTAQFSAVTRTYTVTVQSNNTEYGTVNPTSATVPYGTSFTTSENHLSVGSTAFTATPAPATTEQTYILDSWSPSSGTVTGPTTITATFVPTTNTYTVALTSNGGGSVTGGGVYEYGSSVEISAVPDIGYSFVKWSDDVTEAVRTITVTDDISLTAYFKWDAPILKMYVNVLGTWVLLSDNSHYGDDLQ